MQLGPSSALPPPPPPPPPPSSSSPSSPSTSFCARVRLLRCMRKTSDGSRTTLRTHIHRTSRILTGVSESFHFLDVGDQTKDRASLGLRAARHFYSPHSIAQRIIFARFNPCLARCPAQALPAFGEEHRQLDRQPDSQGVPSIRHPLPVRRELTIHRTLAGHHEPNEPR